MAEAREFVVACPKCDLMDYLPPRRLPDDMRVRDVRLSVRSHNAIMRLFDDRDVRCGQVRHLSDEALLSVRNLGQCSLREIRMRLGVAPECAACRGTGLVRIRALPDDIPTIDRVPEDA